MDVSAFGGETQNMVEEKEEQVEAALSQKVLFAASCIIVLCGFLGFVSALTAGKLAVAVNLLFIFFYGLILALLDPPIAGENPTITQVEVVISRYANLLTSVTGKGLGVAITGRLLSNANYAGNMSGIMSFLMCSFIAIVGFMTFAMGFLKTRKLSAARDAIVSSAPPGYVESQVENVIQPFANVYPVSMGPQAGLTPDEFNNFVQTVARSEPFNEVDIKLVFKQLRQDKGLSGSGGNRGGKFKQPKLTVADLRAWFDKRSVLVML